MIMFIVGGNNAGNHSRRRMATNRLTSLSRVRSTDKKAKPASQFSLWSLTTTLLTCLIPGFALKWIGRMPNPAVQRAWREKVALCMLIVFFCLCLAFITYGLTTIVCVPPKKPVYRMSMVERANDDEKRWFIIHGRIYNLPETYKPYKHKSGFDPYKTFATMDLSAYFPVVSSACTTAMSIKSSPCQIPGSNAPSHCHQPDLINDLEYVGDLALDWNDIGRSPLEDGRKTRFAYNGQVFDVATYLDQVSEDNLSKMPFGPRVDRIIRRSVGGDATKALSAIPPIIVQCLSDQFRAGYLEVKTMGCIATDIVLYVSLVVILTVVIANLCLPSDLPFRWQEDWERSRRGNNKRTTTMEGGGGSGKKAQQRRILQSKHSPTIATISRAMATFLAGQAASVLSPLKSPSMQRSSRFSMAQNRVRPAPRPSIHASYLNANASSRASISTGRTSISTGHANTPMLLLDSTTSRDHMYCILLVTCYSEDEQGIKTTLDSLANTDYDDQTKVAICRGRWTHHGIGKQSLHT